MRTAATAMLWESWRLTRRQMAFGILIAIVGGGAFIALNAAADRDRSATIVLLLIMVLSLPMSRWVGLDRGGFPFYLGYARPIPTWLLAGLPMAYHAISCAALYLIPIIVLRTAFGIPFPLLPLAASLAAIRLVFTTCHWWARDRTVQLVGLVSAGVLGFFIIRRLRPVNLPGNDLPPERWPDMFAFSWADYGVIAFAIAAAIGVTIVGVERQRRGDDQFDFFGSGGNTAWFPRVPNWLDGLFRAPCPTSSPTRAQLWFEMKFVGIRVLALGVALAAGIPLLLSLANAYRWDPAIILAVASPLAPLFVGITSTFGIRHEQGISYMSPFDATRAIGTARLVGLKVFVTVVCLLGAWIVIGTSLWVSLPLFSDVNDFGQLKSEIAATLSALPSYRLAGMAAVALIQFSTAVAFLATKQVFLALYGRRAILGLMGLALYFLAAVTAVSRDWVGASFVEAHAWAIAALIPVGTLFLFREALADRILAQRHTAGAVLVWAGFAATSLAPLRDSAVLPSGMPLAFMALAASLSLLPLAAFALAPWSFGLIRHS